MFWRKFDLKKREEQGTQGAPLGPIFWKKGADGDCHDEGKDGIIEAI
ncbi:hypothetical protein STRDD13_00085 [Streptococcus sp. DD13]|nr:hypothetical protein STRDD13_00085 [Streptococcus sp. DD13]